MPVEPPHRRVERLFAEQYAALLAFFRRRTLAQSDVADLAQEAYLRFLRAPDPEAIRSPEAYLYTIAGNLLREQAVARGHRARSVALEEAQFAALLQVEPVGEDEHDRALRRERLREVLDQLPPKCRAALVLQYQYDWSYREIGEHLGVSTNMVKKYLAQGLAHCRRRMGSLG